MGLACSKSALERFHHLGDIVRDSARLTVYATHGLLPRARSGVPLWIFSEHHDKNESQEHGKENCLKLMEAITQTASTNCTTQNQVILLYEAMTVSDNPFLRTENDDDLDTYRLELQRYYADKVNISATRYAVQGRLTSQHHIKAVPMDVFGRMREFTLDDDIERPSYSTKIASLELANFWESVGYDVELKTIAYMSSLAESLSGKIVDSFFEKFPDSRASIDDVTEAFTCYFLATLAFQINKPTPSKRLCLARAQVDAKELMGTIMSDTPETSHRLSDNPRIPGFSLEEYRDQIRARKVFMLLGLAGDMVVLEYLTGPTWKGTDHMVVMHAGYAHASNIRRWLKVSHNVVHERITQMARSDSIFMQHFDDDIQDQTN